MFRLLILGAIAELVVIGDWTAVEKDENIPWDLEGTPLQLRTDSTVGSGQIIRVEMYKNAGSYVGGVEVRLTSLVRYRLYHCINSYTDLPVELPVEVEKIWTIIKTGTALIITCNNLEVLNYVFADSSNTKCVKKLGGDVVEVIKFHGWDAASDFYRAGKRA
uniref:Putative secretory peptide-15 n=1 Tax=Pleurobrachia bachei TaxID=34499 RepID=M4H1V7_PLEBA|nr:putative secretory peptide-15 [Pleurobrachia bachei]|eukprot:sb/3472780/